jgi:uncharacterized protein
MWPRFWKPFFIVIPSAAIVLAVLYMTYRFIDPIPPRHFVIAAGMAGSGYDNFARQYARILARDDVELEVRNAAGAVEGLNLLRDGASGVQAALTALGFTRTGDEDTLYSLGGVFDAPIFIFYRNAEPITQFAQFRGKRLSIGTPGTALRALILQVLTATDAVEASAQLLDLDSTEAIDALIAGEIDVAIFASQLDTSFLQRALGAPGLRLMNVAQAEAIAKTVPGLKHLVLSRGIISLTRDIPNSALTCLPPATACSCEKIFTPPCNICCWKPCARCTGHPAPLTGSVNFPPSNPMICRFLQRQRHFTAPARASGSATRRSG